MSNRNFVEINDFIKSNFGGKNPPSKRDVLLSVERGDLIHIKIGTKDYIDQDDFEAKLLKAAPDKGCRRTTKYNPILASLSSA
jgi:hypothetical protein